MKSKRIKTLLASVLTASLIVSSGAAVFATPTPPHRNMSTRAVKNMLSNLTAKQRAALEQLEATPSFRISPDINLKSSEKVKVIVQFKQDPARVEMVKNQIKGRRISLQSAEANVEDSHAQFKQDLNRIMGNEKLQLTIQTNQELDRAAQNEGSVLDEIKIHSEFKNAFNGVSMTIPGNAIEKLLESDVVKTVWKDYEIKLDLPKVSEEDGLSVSPYMEDSVPFIGVDKLHEEGITGRGIKVGVLDTGIDYNHPDLRAVYKGGWDCVDEDADPMETTYEDWKNSNYYPWLPYYEYVTAHGTHVSGTIAGQGMNDGLTSVKGVAPGADIYAYRVLGPGGGGYTDDVMQGIDKAVEDGMDVINLSLGAAINDPLYPTSIAINNAVLTGVVAAISAGNAGPTAQTLGSPGTSSLAITVGASDVAQDVPGIISTIGNDNYDLKLFFNSPSNLEIELEGKTLPLEYVGLGYNSDFEGKDLTGKVAFIQRGDIKFVEKMANAKEAGAEAVIIFNNVKGQLAYMGDNFMEDEPVDIPSFRMTKNEGELIKSQLENGEEVQITFNEYTTVKTIGDYLADFSSRGPVYSSYDIKPDIVAPGVNTLSTVPEYIVDPEGDINYDIAYGKMSGTSMASPHIAGVAALMLQENPEYTPFDVKTVMMNTSEDLTEEYSVFEEGAGRVNAYEAVHSNILIQVKDTTKNVDEEGNIVEIEQITGSLSFGRHYRDGSTITESRVVTIENNDSNNKEFEISVEFNSEDSLGLGTKDAESNGVTIDMPETIIAYGNDTVEFEPKIIVPNSAEAGTYEGYVRLVNKNNADEEYQIPFAIMHVEKGMDYFKFTSNALCTDSSFYFNYLLYPFTHGLLKLRSPMESIDIIVKDGVTGESLGYIGYLNTEYIPTDTEVFLFFIFNGRYYPFTGDENNPISDKLVEAPEGHYKMAMIGTDEDGNVYEVSDDVIIDNTPPEFTILEEPGIYELSDDILTKEIDDYTGQEFEAFWIHGSIYDSTIDYLKEIGHEYDAFGKPIDQALNNPFVFLDFWPSFTPYTLPDGTFKIGIEKSDVEIVDYPRNINIIGVDYGTCGLAMNPYWFEFTKEDALYLAANPNKDEITNGEEITITLSFNNVVDFMSGEAEIPFIKSYFEFVDAKMNPEFQSFADANGVDVDFTGEVIEKWGGKRVLVSADFEEKDGFEGLDGDIKFADITFKYTGGFVDRHFQFINGNANYSKLGEEESISMLQLSQSTFRIKEQYSATGGHIRSEGYQTTGGWTNNKLDLTAGDVKVYAEAPNGERYEATIERGQFLIENLPIIDQNYKIVVESPGHFERFEYSNLFRYLNGELVPVYQTTNIWQALAGDVNGDNVIDILDAISVHDSYGEYETRVPQDINLDYKVDDIDMSYVYKNFMETNPDIVPSVTPKEEFNGTRIEDNLSYLQDKGIFVGNFKAEDSFVQGEKVEVEARIHNFGEKDRNVTLILALYDENNKLIDYVEQSKVSGALVDEPYAPNGMDKIKTNIMTTEETVKVKCFVWDNLNNLEPLVEVFELPVINN